VVCDEAAREIKNGANFLPTEYVVPYNKLSEGEDELPALVPATATKHCSPVNSFYLYANIRRIDRFVITIPRSNSHQAPLHRARDRCHLIHDYGITTRGESIMIHIQAHGVELLLSIMSRKYYLKMMKKHNGKFMK